MENDPEGPDLERSARKILGIPPDGKI